MLLLYLIVLFALPVFADVPKECEKASALWISHQSLLDVISSLKQVEANSLNYIGSALGLAASLGHPIAPATTRLTANNYKYAPPSLSGVVEIFKSGSESIVPQLTSMLRLQSTEEVIDVLLSFAGAMGNDLQRLPPILNTLYADRDSLHTSLQGELRVCMDTLGYDVAIIQSRVRRLSSQIDTIKKRFPSLDQCFLSEISSAIHSHYLAPLEHELAQAEAELQRKERSIDDIRIIQGESSLDRSMSFV